MALAQVYHPLIPTLDQLLRVRSQTLDLAAPLSLEDTQAQSMPDASPTKWHLAHTTWFFETFVVLPGLPGYREVNPAFQVLFNSYYNSVGPQHPRPQRGLLTRPALEEVLRYRRTVDQALSELAQDQLGWSAKADVILLGIHHEQQHQELLLTDIKHLLSCNPLHPVYRSDLDMVATPGEDLAWLEFTGGLNAIGADNKDFCFDNETPRHQVFQPPFTLASRPVTNREFADFMADGGYTTPTLWLSDGWDLVRRNNWHAPLYWQNHDGQWLNFTLAGLQPIDPDAPVVHISYFEADAYARWSQARLPNEVEWEIAASAVPVAGNFVEKRRLQPGGSISGANRKLPSRMFGDVWEWTASPYTAYPGYRQDEGALGEYNAKFMCNQLVLRGGSCVSPADHLRASYRNFFQPEHRWQFSGLRLARDLC